MGFAMGLIVGTVAGVIIGLTCRYIKVEPEEEGNNP